LNASGTNFDKLPINPTAAQVRKEIYILQLVFYVVLQVPVVGPPRDALSILMAPKRGTLLKKFLQSVIETGHWKGAINCTAKY